MLNKVGLHYRMLRSVVSLYQLPPKFTHVEVKIKVGIVS